MVAGTITLDDGARLLEILDPAALAQIENVPHVQMLRTIGRNGGGGQFAQRAQRRHCISFRVGGTAFAFEMCAIREIIMVPELMPSVMASPLCLGRINFRGHAVGVVDFAALLQFGAHADGIASERRILVALVGETLIGFLVDSVDSIFHVNEGEVLPIPLLSKARAAMFAGCVSGDNGADVLFLNHEGIFSQSELVEIGAGHVRLYEGEAEAAGGAQRARSARNRAVYVVFSLDSPWAVEIGQLREIICWRDGMVQPPGLPRCVRGILNLRHQMISVIDLRCPARHGAGGRPEGAQDHDHRTGRRVLRPARRRGRQPDHGGRQRPPRLAPPARRRHPRPCARSDRHHRSGRQRGRAQCVRSGDHVHAARAGAALSRTLEPALQTDSDNALE